MEGDEKTATLSQAPTSPLISIFLDIYIFWANSSKVNFFFRIKSPHSRKTSNPIV
jgi:hypothetical protein